MRRTTNCGYFLGFLILCVSGKSVNKPNQLQLPLKSLPSFFGEDVSDMAGIELLGNNKEIYFIGEYNMKSFFYDTEEIADQEGAQVECEANGLKLAEFDSQEEVDFVAKLMPKDFCWTGGVANLPTSSFTWIHSGEVLSSDLILKPDTNFGLRLEIFNEGYGRLFPGSVSDARCYICYKKTAK